jgi:hypothetical protein
MRFSFATLCLLAAAACAADTQRVHVHGYGEVHSNNDLDHDRKLDVHRAVIGLKAELAANAFFNLEVDFEHAFKEPELEFAYVDWALTPSLTVRMGDMLMPVGPLNEFHEPPLFLSVERPYLHNKLIPTTWQEVGAGLVLSFPEQGLGFRAYLVNGLNGAKIRAEKGLKGFRSGRFKGIDVIAEDVAGVARVEYSPLAGLHLGASGYFGGADQHADADSQMTVGLYEADIKYKLAGLQLQGQVGFGTMGGEYFSSINADDKTMLGYLAEAAYFISDLAGPGSQIAPFARYENINLNLGDDAAKTGEQVITGGVAFYPNPNLALKADAECWMAEKDAYVAKSGKAGDAKTVLNLGLGVMF